MITSDEGEAFFDSLQAEMVGAGDSMAQAVQRMWTSFQQLRGREFCFILNEVVRNDTASCIAPAASLPTCKMHRVGCEVKDVR